MLAFPLSSLHPHLPFRRRPSLDLTKTQNPNPNPNPNPSFLLTETLIYPPKPFLLSKSLPNSTPNNGNSESESESEISVSSFPPKPLSNSSLIDSDSESESEPFVSSSDSESVSEVETKIEKIRRNAIRIRSRIRIEAGLETVWNLLTNYEGLADFIPGLAVCRLLEKGENFAKLYQVGQQNLAFGLKFNAKGIVDCYEKDLEHLPFGRRRDIEFKMVEGDFQTFEGKWSILQADEKCKDDESSEAQEFRTVLSYIVDVEPKLWLPVGLVEGRLCREIEVNLLCIREEARRSVFDALPTC
ncbi:uncharacterized protein LOC143855632 [Tasmannia lanceolata]|uniref:uncharacterized protein LOC143855632 n=1 Tax=Tasmannia lanceolata TaxID=3420 RepID=UPI0040642EFD